MTIIGSVFFPVLHFYHLLDWLRRRYFEFFQWFRVYILAAHVESWWLIDWFLIMINWLSGKCEENMRVFVLLSNVVKYTSALNSELIIRRLQSQSVNSEINISADSTKLLIVNPKRESYSKSHPDSSSITPR